MDSDDSLQLLCLEWRWRANIETSCIGLFSFPFQLLRGVISGTGCHGYAQLLLDGELSLPSESSRLWGIACDRHSGLHFSDPQKVYLTATKCLDLSFLLHHPMIASGWRTA